MGHGHGECSGAICTKSSLRYEYRWFMRGRGPRMMLEQRGWEYGGEYGDMISGRLILTY